MVMVGCRAVTPSPVPPLAEELGYTIPHFRMFGVDWTTIGIIEAVIKYEKIRLETLSVTSAATIKMVDSARSQTLDILTALGIGGAGALPLALAKVPKGYKKEDEAA